MIREIPELRLTAGQQGGIGYAPTLVKLGRWYAVSDSRERKAPPELQQILKFQRRFLSVYGYRRNPQWHPQSWVWKRWHGGVPRLTWAEVAEQAGVKLEEG